VRICVEWPTVSFTCCVQVASGRRCRLSLVRPARCIGTFKSGASGTSFSVSGRDACKPTTGDAASAGGGKVWTGRKPRRRWVGKKTGKNPTDRGKLGVKRSVITDARGVPLGIAIDGANRHDAKLLRATLQSMPLRRPTPTGSSKQHLCLDKGYFGKPSETLARRFGYVPHIPPKGKDSRIRRPGQRARRWVVEGSHSWANRARRLLVRWEKKADNYLAFVHLQFAYIALKHAGVLG